MSSSSPTLSGSARESGASNAVQSHIRTLPPGLLLVAEFRPPMADAPGIRDWQCGFVRPCDQETPASGRTRCGTCFSVDLRRDITCDAKSGRSTRKVWF
jgi:hypothetical protein